MTTKNMLQKCFIHTPLEEQFPELILALDDRIYLSPSFDAVTDWSRVYYDGHVCVHQHDSMYCLGGLPEKCRFLPIIVGTTNLSEPEDGGCFLFSETPVLGEAASVFAIFRYKDMLGLYMADRMVSRGSYFCLMEYTPGEERFFDNLFARMLFRHDPGALEKVDAWLNRHAACGKGV